MKIRSKDPDPIRSLAAERMERLSTSEILDWMDVAGSGVARALQDYRRHGNEDYLSDARNGIDSLRGCIDVIESRAH
jgi:hypothetical protein